MVSKYQYGVVLDAGSSGTRIYVYRWYKNAIARALAHPEELQQLPAIYTKNKWSKKLHPGISTFADRPDEVGKEYLKELFEHALDIVPEDEIASTPFFLLATAGMRLVPDLPRRRLLAEVCAYVQKKTDFKIADCNTNIQVIPGETEGLYGWIASNYLVGAFSKPADLANGKDHSTYGFLDMGGASAQIAFAPNITEAEKHANDLKLLRLRTIDGEEADYRVFVTTWLGYGANEARRRYVDSLAKSFDTAETAHLPDPCLPKGLEIHQDGNMIATSPGGSEPTLVGTGRFSECLAATYPLLDKDAMCIDPPCLFHGVHVPAIDFDINHFIGVSEFWHSTHEIFEMDHLEKAFDFNTYQSRVEEFCSKDWSDIEEGIEDGQWGKKVDAQKAAESCFKASWIINMLHGGIGIPRIGIEASSSSMNSEADTPTKELIEGAEEAGFKDAPYFQAMNNVDDVEISWTLGKMVLYASSMVPPANADIQAVGFGSNIPGTVLPEDFQYPGGKPDLSVLPGGALPWDPKNPTTFAFDEDDSDDDDDDDEDNSWTSKLLGGDDLEDRAPGILMIIAILLLVAFVLMGRERRQNVYRKINPFSSRNTGRYDTDSGSPSRLKKFLKRIGIGGKDQSQKYERVMEEGNSSDFIPRPEDFELHGLPSSSNSSASDDDDTKSLSSKGSARKSRQLPNDHRNTSLSRSASSSDFLSTEGFANGTGHRSRAGSPTRRMTPLREAAE
jgi:Golgi apyrase